MAKTHTDGEYVAALETKSQMDALVHQLFINERRGKPKFKTQEEFDKAYHEFEARYYNSLPSESSQITGWTRAAFHAFESATHELTNFKDPDRGTMDATQTFVKSGFTNALLQAMTQDTSALKTVQSGQELIKGVIARDAKIRFTTTHEFAVNANMAEQKRAFENIFAHGGKYMNFDVEDIGDYITQYSFGTFDPTLGKHLNVVKDSVRSGMIGLNKQAHDAAMALVDEYEKMQLARNGKIGVPKEKEYMLREFMKMGLAGDNAWKQEENGRIKLLKYASNEDAQVYDVDTMRKGIETLFQINKAATQQMFDFHGHKMYRYEIDAAESFMNASKNGGLTLSSTNGLGHDIPMFEKMFGRNGFASEGAKAWFQEFTNGTGRLGDSINHLDVTAVGRELVSDAFVRQHPEAAAEAYRKGEFFNSAEGNWQAYIPGEDQTAILEEVGSFIGGADQKHTSEADMLKQGANLQYMIDQWKDVDKDYLARLQQTGKANGRTDASIFGRIGPEHTAAGGQLFYVNDGQFAKNSTGFSLMFDASSGEYRFANNVRVGKEARGDIVTTGIKKNTVAMLVAAPKELDFKSVEGEKLLDTAMQAGFEPNGEKLFAASFVTYGEQKYNGKRNIYTIVGTQDELQKFFQKNSYAGEISKDAIVAEIARQIEEQKYLGQHISPDQVTEDSKQKARDLTANWTSQDWTDAALDIKNARAVDTSLIDDKTKRRLSTEVVGPDGKKKVEFKAENYLRHSVEVTRNDSAGNWLRDMSYKKANRILDFLDIYTKFSSDFFGFDTEVERAQNRSKISEAIFRAYETGGEFGKTAEQKKAYQTFVKSLNGLMKTGSDYPLYSNTIRQMVATVGWESGMKDVLSAVIQKTQQVAGSSDKDVLEGTYQQIYQNTLANIAHKANQQFHISLDPQDALGKGNSEYILSTVTDKDGNKKAVVHEAGRRTLSRMGEQIHSFEIEITGIMQQGKLEDEHHLGSSLHNKFVIDLDKKESFGKRLARQLGYTDPDNAQIVTALRKLGRTIYEQYGEGNGELEDKLKPLRNINDQSYSAESAMALIRDQLKVIRDANPDYGYVDGVTLADIDHAPTAVRLLSEEIDSKELSEDEKALEKQKVIASAVDEASQNLTKVEVKRKPKELAKDLTKKLFEKTEGITRDDLSRHGYSKTEIDSILTDRSQRKLETRQFLEIVLGKTYGVHSDWGYKIDGDNVYLKTDSGKMLNISKYLPYDHFDEAMGTFRTIIGGRSLATTKIVTWDVTDGKKIPSMGSLGVHSLIGEFANNAAQELLHTNSGSRSSEENLKNVDYFLRRALDPIVDKAVTKFDKEDIKLGNYLDFSAFYNRLGLYNAQGAFNDIWSKLSDSTQIALRSMTARLQKEQAEHPNEVIDEITPKTQEMIAILGDFHRLVAPLADSGSKLSSLVFRDREDAEDFAKNYANRINLQGLKHPDKGYISLARSSDVFGGLGPDPRHFDSVLSRAHELQNVDRFRDVVLNGDEDLERTTQLDSIVLTPEEALQRKNGTGALHAVRTMHLTMNQTEWEDFLAKDSVQKLFQRDLGINTSQFHTYLNESGALINGALLDLGKKNIEQKMRTDELIDTVKMASIIGKNPEAKTREEELRKRTNEIIKLGQDSVSYEYSKDYIVLDKGDVMAWNESFKGMPTDAKAEREGLLKKRYYKDGKEVSEAEINAVLNREENIAALQKEKAKFAIDESLEGTEKEAAIAKQNAALRSIAHEILKDEGYKQYYALESPDAMPTRKVLLGTEKAEARFAMPPLGQIAGSEVAKALGTTREKLASEFPLQYLTGDVLGDMNKLNALLRHHGFNELNETQFNDLGKAVRADQKKFWSTLNQALRDQNYIAKDEYVNAISATEFEAAKGSHSEVARMRTRINESVDLLARAMAAKDNKEISPEYIQRASDTIQKDLAGVFRSSDGKDTLVRSADAGTGNESFTVGRPDDVNVTKFNQVMAKYNPDFKDYAAGVDGAVRIEAAPAGGGVGNISIKVGDTYQTIKGPYTYDANGRMIAKTGITELRFADDADEGRINSGDERGIKVTRRMTTALEKDIYSNAGIQKTYENMIKLENFVGKDAYDAEKNFNEMYRGIASVKRNDKGELSLDIEKDAAGRNINDAIIKNLHEEVIAGTDSSMQITTWNPKQNERVYRSLEDAGINRKHAEKIVASLNDQGFNRIGSDTLKNEYAYATGRLATSFNKEMEKAVTVADKQNIVDKYIGYGLLGDDVIDISNVSFERQNTNGDLNNLLERQGIVKVGDNYVAVGYEPTSIMDNDNGQGVHDMTDTRSKLRDVQRQYTDRLNETTGEQRTEAEHQLQEKINDFASTQEKSVTSKGGALARTGEAYLQDSAMFKANIIRVRNGNATVNGFKGTDMEGKAVSANELLKTAKVNGVSIAEHETAGHAVNATFVGRGFFENMVKGKDFQQALATTLEKDVSNLTEDDTKQALENILRQASVKGGTGIELRQPLEYLGSVQGMHIFYDSSLSSNQALVTEAAAKIQKADQDGDTIFAHMSRSEAVVQGANGSEKIRLNQLQVASLNAVAGRNVASFEDDGAQLRQIDRAGDSVANVTSSNVPPLDNGNSLEETFWTKNGYDNQKVNGHIYDVSGFSSNEINTQEDKMNDIIGSERFQKFVNRKYGINMADSQNDDTKEFAKDLVHNIAEYEYGGDTLHIADDYVKDLQKHGMGAEAKEATKAFGVSFANMANKDTLAKTMARMNAGINNMNSYRFNTLVNSLQDAGLTDYRSGDHIIVGHVLEHINDAFQAPKNSTSANQIDSREFGEALQDFFGARTGRRDTTKLYKILGDMYDDGIKELKNLPQIEGLETNGGMISKERMFQAMDHVMQSDQVLNPVAWEQARVGYANSEIESKYRTTNTNDIKSVSDNVTNALLEENGAGELDLKDAPLTVASRSVAAQHSIFDDDNHDHFMNSAAEDAEEAGLEDTIKGTFRTIGHALNHGGAKAMLGFAGAMMMAGMTGGAPTSPTPAQGQAKGIQSENAMYEIPPSMPSGALGRTQPQSYIINVNASTSRGRDFATQAINQAMASMPQTSSGNQMTMNIKDSSSSIGFGDIANYVSGML